jgi:hypothetical protein
MLQRRHSRQYSRACKDSRVQSIVKLTGAAKGGLRSAQNAAIIASSPELPVPMATALNDVPCTKSFDSSVQ